MGKKIGITGGIGSGKTLVCSIFASMGIPIYNADERAKWLMQNHQPLKEEIIKAFGSEVYNGDGALQNAVLAQKVFGNKAQLEILNGLVHPAVAKDGQTWQEQHQHAPYTIKEAALLYESGSYKSLDKIIVVAAPESIRIERVLKRNTTSVEEIKKRMAYQMPEEEKISRADYVLVNDGQTPLLKQVLELHKVLVGE